MPEAEEKQEEEEQEDQDLWTLYSPLISGGWKCLSFNLFSKSHPPKLLAQPHGATPLGRLYISPRGWLAVHLAVPDRDVASDKKKKKEEDRLNVNGGLAMYCGYLKLYRRSGEEGGEEGELYWRTMVEVSSDSNLIGGVQERKVVFEEMERKKKKSSDGDSGSGSGSDGGGQQEEEKSYYMILEPKQDWIMEVCNIGSFSFFLLSLPAAAGWLALVGLDWNPFFPFLPPFFFSRLSFLLFGKMGMIFSSHTELSTLQLSTLQLSN